MNKIEAVGESEERTLMEGGTGLSDYMSEELMGHSRAVRDAKNPIKLTFNNLNYEVEI
jgi:hypothetical protein|tara:strand:- start:2634 stop:2807 length:174 start_codon:yes stop_codon:yes gene_type:complete